MVLVVKVVGAKVDTEEVMAAVTDKAVMAVAMMDTEEATIITAVGTAAMVVTTTVDTVILLIIIKRTYTRLSLCRIIMNLISLFSNNQ